MSSSSAAASPACGARARWPRRRCRSRSSIVPTTTCSSRCSTRWRRPACRRATSPRRCATSLRGQRNVTVRLGEVSAIDTAAQRVSLADGMTLAYDYLLVASGATHAYFGHDEWAAHAPGLKTLDDAMTLRRRILLAFEQAENAQQRCRARRLADVCRRRRRPHRRRARRHAGRDRAPHAEERVPPHRPGQGACATDRSRAARAGDLSAGAVRQGRGATAAPGRAGAHRQRGAADRRRGLHARRRARAARRRCCGPPAWPHRRWARCSARRRTAPAACRCSPISPCPASPTSSSPATWPRSRRPTASRCPAWRPRPSRWARMWPR